MEYAHRAELVIGDALLLCSDGLNKHLSDEQIEQLLKDSESAEAACHKLVDAANQAGGSDNITVVLARFLENAAPPVLVDEAAIQVDDRQSAELVDAQTSPPPVLDPSEA